MALSDKLARLREINRKQFDHQENVDPNSPLWTHQVNAKHFIDVRYDDFNNNVKKIAEKYMKNTKLVQDVIIRGS